MLTSSVVRGHPMPEPSSNSRNATAAIVGAVDFIGAAIAR
jgi:hypothetical protein